MQVPLEKHECLIPREWFLVKIIIKRGFEGFLEISFYKIVFEKLNASQAETWTEIFPLHTHSFRIFYF